MRVVLGVSGGIAAYKAASLLRLFREAGHSVRVVPTAAALRFVGAATWEALSGEPVTQSMFDDVPQVPHVALGKDADLVVVAPATADLLARAAVGRADDLLTATLLTARCPIVLAPAMHTEMWQHPATQANVATLRSRGVQVLEPASGRLTGRDSGPGRLPEPEEIYVAALAAVQFPPQDMVGRRVVITAGGTREPIDPVRWLGNRSTGKQGLALASTAARRGADVLLIAANIDEALLATGPASVQVRRVETTEQLRAAVSSVRSDADAVVMAAAIADFRPAEVAATKIKKAESDDSVSLHLDLVANPDILAELVRTRRPGQVIVGFAAETGDHTGSVLELGRAKARRKGADLLAVNAVGEGLGFGTDHNEVWVLDCEGTEVAHATGSKSAVADAIWDAVTSR